MAILFAFATMIFAACSSLAIDEGALYLQRRSAQAAADLAAIAAASAPAHAFARARSYFDQAGLIPAGLGDAEVLAGIDGTRLQVELGRYTADAHLPVESRFVPDPGSPSAARVHFDMPGTLYFARLWSTPPDIEVVATASATPVVAFSVGSELLRLQGGLANAVLQGMLGTQVELSALSYRGLASAQVSLFDALDALAQELDIRAGTYEDLLKASASRGQVARALASASTGAGRNALLLLADSFIDDRPLPLGRLFDLGEAGRLSIGQGASAGLAANVSALAILVADAAIGEGAHQVALDLTTGLPGLASLRADLAVGEPAQAASWYAVGPSGTQVRTAQLRLRLTASIGGGALLPDLLVHLPIYLQVASAEARVQSATCPAAGASNGTATIATRPGIASLSIGEVADPAFAQFPQDADPEPARMIDLPALRVVGSAGVTIDQVQPVLLVFSADDVSKAVTRTATTTSPIRSLSAALLRQMRLRISVLGLGVPAARVVDPAIRHLLAPLAPTLDGVIEGLIGTLGISIGNADVTVHGVTCRRAALVQ